MGDFSVIVDILLRLGRSIQGKRRFVKLRRGLPPDAVAAESWWLNARQRLEKSYEVKQLPLGLLWIRRTSGREVR